MLVVSFLLFVAVVSTAVGVLAIWFLAAVTDGRLCCFWNLC
jgi:hypothetical protein